VAELGTTRRAAAEDWTGLASARLTDLAGADVLERAAPEKSRQLELVSSTPFTNGCIELEYRRPR
jgi:hypothetical protein